MTENHSLANADTADRLFAQWSSHWELSKPYLIEKTPINLVRTRFFQALFPTASFIVIVRHPAAVALATSNALASNGAAQGLSIADLIEHWLLCHEIFLSDAPHLKHLLVLKYEDFVAEPQAMLDRIYTSLGLPTFPCAEEVEAGINDRYQSQWNAMQEDSQMKSSIGDALQFEERIRGFGYSLQDWSVSKPLSENLETCRAGSSGYPVA